MTNMVTNLRFIDNIAANFTIKILPNIKGDTN